MIELIKLFTSSYITKLGLFGDDIHMNNMVGQLIVGLIASFIGGIILVYKWYTSKKSGVIIHQNDPAFTIFNNYIKTNHPDLIQNFELKDFMIINFNDTKIGDLTCRTKHDDSKYSYVISGPNAKEFVNDLMQTENKDTDPIVESYYIKCSATECEWSECQSDITYKETMELTKEQQKIYEAMKTFTNSSDKYRKNNLKWKFNVFMHGIPGSGKSSLVEYIALKLNIPVFKLNLDSINDS